MDIAESLAFFGFDQNCLRTKHIEIYSGNQQLNTLLLYYKRDAWLVMLALPCKQ